jgi:alpha-ketoglutarate-dependent taurine dioxygenase
MSVTVDPQVTNCTDQLGLQILEISSPDSSLTSLDKHNGPVRRRNTTSGDCAYCRPCQGYPRRGDQGEEDNRRRRGHDDSQCRICSVLSQSALLTLIKYPHYLPIWDHGEKYPPLEPFIHVDHGKDADPTFKDLLTEGTKIQKLTPTTGSEITGVQLSKLSPAGKDQLALLVAQRKVVAFRDQDFADLPTQEALDFGGYFGRHHIHPTSGAPEGYPEVHLVHRNGSSSEFDAFLANRNSSVGWHSDVTYEQQPPGTTFLYIFDSPEVGGDTAFVNQVEAYNRLSPALKERLHGLTAIHSGFEQAEFSKKRGGVIRREPVSNEHPLVRTHPVTGEKALFVNGGCK